MIPFVVPSAGRVNNLRKVAYGLESLDFYAVTLTQLEKFDAELKVVRGMKEALAASSTSYKVAQKSK